MKKNIVIILLLFISGLANAQVKIGGPGNPDSNAVLELDGGNNKGLLLPRLTSSRMNQMTTAPNGMIIFNTTDGFIYCRTGGNWQKIGNGGGGVFALPFADTISLSNGFAFDVSNSATGGAAILGKGLNTSAGVIGYSLNGNGVVGNSEHGTGGYFSTVDGPAAIYAGGNIGINEAAPHSPITFSPAQGNKISFSGSAAANFGIGIQNELLQFYSPDASSNIGFGFGSSSNFTERMRIMGNGHVGIGHGAPYAPLTIGTNWGNKIALFGSNDGALQYGFGVQPSQMQLYVPYTSADFSFGYGNSDNFTELMRLKGNGRLGIGTTTPAISSVLDLTSTNKGFLAPRMTAANRNGIASPANGLMVYDSTSNSHWYYNGSSWVNMIDYSKLKLPFDTTVNLNTTPFRINNSGTASAITGASGNDYGIGLTGTSTGIGGWGVYGIANSANAIGVNAFSENGIAIKAYNNNLSNTNPALDVTNKGTGNTVTIRTQNATNNQASLNITHNGNGSGVMVQLTNPLNDKNGIHVIHSGTGNGVYAFSENETAIKGEGGTGNGSTGVFGTSAATNGTGVTGTSATGVGVSGTSGNGYGVTGFSTSGTGVRASSNTGLALDVFGKLKITGLQTMASNGAVLTSDANGNADWVNNRVAFRAKNIPAVTNTYPEDEYKKVEFTSQDYDLSNGYTLYAGSITSNSSTFLIPKNGIYHFDAALRLYRILLVENRHLFIQLVVKRNGVVSVIAENEFTPFHDNGLSVNISTDVNLLAGDRVWVEFKHTNLIDQEFPLVPNGHNNYFSGHIVLAL
jgi:C1q domain